MEHKLTELDKVFQFKEGRRDFHIMPTRSLQHRTSSDSASLSTKISESSEEQPDLSGASYDSNTESDDGSHSSSDALDRTNNHGGRNLISSTRALIEVFKSNLPTDQNSKDLTIYLANLEKIVIVVVEGLLLESQSPLLRAARFSAIQSGVAAVEHILSETLLGTEEEGHAKIWGAIFKDLAWLNKITSKNGDPVILGASIEDLYQGSFWSSRLSTAFWVLLIGCPDEYRFEKDLFMKCLQPHIYNEKLYDVHFTNGLVLNVANVMNEKSEEIILTPRRVFRNGGSKEKPQLFSYYLFWHGDLQLHTLYSKNIQGLGGVVTRITQIYHVCQISLKRNEKEYSYIFKTNCKSMLQAKEQIEQFDLLDEIYYGESVATGLYFRYP